jgi:hypothetical protein
MTGIREGKMVSNLAIVAIIVVLSLVIGVAVGRKLRRK